MLKKGFLFAISLLCLFATFSIAKGLISQNGTQEVSSYFSKADSSIYAISFPSLLSLEKEKIQSTSLNMDLVNSLFTSIPDNCTIYFSKKRGVVIFEANDEWTQGGLKDLFRNGQHKIKFLGNRKIQFGAYRGRYSKGLLILNDSKESIESGKYQFTIDRKATFSEIIFNDSIAETTNYYKKGDALISYINESNKAVSAKNILDEQLYSKFISAEFDSYEFYEKTYLGILDPEFKTNPFYRWINKGVLLLKKGKESVILLDMKEGQTLLENINDTNGNENAEKNFQYLKGIKLPLILDSTEKTGVYASDIEGFAILSKNKLLFDQFTTEVSLGNSLGMNKIKMQQLYGDLPKAVLHRSYNKAGDLLAVSTAGNEWVTTKYESEKNKEINNEEGFKSYLSMNPSEKISSFYAYSGRGNTFLITESNKWIRYENGIRMWEKTFDRPVVKEPKLMEMSSEKNQDISILFDDEAIIIDKYGRILNRFPTSGAVHPIRFRLKNKIAFLIPNTNRMNVTDNDGRNKSVYNFSSPILDMVLFKENNRKHVGVLCEKTFFVIDLEQRRTKRKIQLEDSYELLKFQEFSVIISKNKDHTIDMFEKKSAISKPEGFQYMNAFFNGSNIELLFAKENELITINTKGQFIGQKTLGCSSIDKVSIYSSENKPIQIGVLDGIENKIVLLDSKNLTETAEKRRGEKNLQLTTYDHRGISITTFLGEILIQYTKF